MFWANLLHIYQPPTQDDGMLSIIVSESYSQIIKALKENPKAKLTMNINASLSELLVKYKYTTLINDIKILLESGQLELTESAAYHPFLPLIPKTEIIRQIKLNNRINKEIFGDSYNPTGFFAPELAVSTEVVDIVANMGYKWMLFDELAFDTEKGSPQYDRIYKVNGTDMIGFFRDREISFKILSAQLETGNVFMSEIKNIYSNNRYLATAMDGETFGHHRLGLELLLFDLFKSKEMITEQYQNIPKYFTKTDKINIKDSTWALLPIELLRNTPYKRWYNSDNEINLKQWDLTYFAIKEVNKSKYKVKDPKLTNKKEQYSEKQLQWLKARYMLDKSIHSDQYWWASARPWWSIDMIERGANELKNSVLLLPDIDDKIRNKVINSYKDIVTNSFRLQGEGVIDEMINNYDEEASEIIETKSLESNPKEYDRVINHLRRQMLEAADKENFKKAIEYRKRIENLKQKQKNIINNLDIKING